MPPASQKCSVVPSQKLLAELHGATHVVPEQTEPPAHLHVPPQPSSPHEFAAQVGLQVVDLHLNVPGSQIAAALGHVPQLPPQPSSPHSLPEQAGVQEMTHLLAALQVGAADGQVPHVPPHPSPPHSLPLQAGVQASVDASLPVLAASLVPTVKPKSSAASTAAKPPPPPPDDAHPAHIDNTKQTRPKFIESPKLSECFIHQTAQSNNRDVTLHPFSLARNLSQDVLSTPVGGGTIASGGTA